MSFTLAYQKSKFIVLRLLTTWNCVPLVGLLNSLLWSRQNGLPPSSITLHLGCSYHLYLSHPFLSTWDVVRTIIKKTHTHLQTVTVCTSANDITGVRVLFTRNYRRKHHFIATHYNKSTQYLNLAFRRGMMCTETFVNCVDFMVNIGWETDDVLNQVSRNILSCVLLIVSSHSIYLCCCFNSTISESMLTDKSMMGNDSGTSSHLILRSHNHASRPKTFYSTRNWVCTEWEWQL